MVGCYRVFFLFFAQVDFSFGIELTETIRNFAGEKTKIFITSVDMGDSIYKVGACR